MVATISSFYHLRTLPFLYIISAILPLTLNCQSSQIDLSSPITVMHDLIPRDATIELLSNPQDSVKKSREEVWILAYLSVDHTPLAQICFLKSDFNTLLPSLEKILGMIKRNSIKGKSEGPECRVCYEDNCMYTESFSFTDDTGLYVVLGELTIFDARHGPDIVHIYFKYDQLDQFISNVKIILKAK